MIGVLLVNLGTPASPSVRDVRKYLKEFLSDPRVIDINPVGRWFLVNAIIAPFRSPRTAASYQKVWLPAGSPLAVHSQSLTQGVQQELGPEYAVELGMRYGEPSLRQALLKLQSRGVQEIRVLPLYPQYASSTTGSTEAALLALDKKLKGLPELRFLPPFFDHPAFVNSFAERAEPLLQTFKPDHVFFSFHGLPVRQIVKEDVGGAHCLKRDDCCEQMIPANGMCYRAHCVQSARGIARVLRLAPQDYTISFQSRLGRTPWITPFTDQLLSEWAQLGKKKVAVFCPSFVCDCLETLEEIAIRAREDFIHQGGEDLLLIPSLNDFPPWIRALSAMIRGESH